MKSSVRLVWMIGLSILCWPSGVIAKSPIGVLVLAHGGSAEWNRSVTEVVHAAQLPYPNEIAFGMGMHEPEIAGMQQALHRLEAAGVDRIIVVPFLVSSYSEVMDQFAYLLGLQPHGPWEGTIQPLTRRVPISLERALDADPSVSEALWDRVRALSRDPSKESIVLLAHGPVSDAYNAKWLDVMGQLAERLEQAGRFKAVVSVTLRDDAPDPVRNAAVRRIREQVRALGQDGDVLIVPLLISQGGIEQKIPKELQGLTYRYAGETLLPHPAFSAWLRARVEAAANRQPPANEEVTMQEPKDKAVKASQQCALPVSDAELRKLLTPEQYRITKQNGTELPFANAYWNNHKAGLYVDIISGKPLFASMDKFESGTGWPSFVQPIDKDAVVEKGDASHGMVRAEVRSKSSDAHLGHVFDDGPGPTKLRYCINSAALRFVPVEDLEREGYGGYRSLFKKARE